MKLAWRVTHLFRYISKIYIVMFVCLWNIHNISIKSVWCVDELNSYCQIVTANVTEYWTLDLVLVCVCVFYNCMLLLTRFKMNTNIFPIFLLQDDFQQFLSPACNPTCTLAPGLHSYTSPTLSIAHGGRNIIITCQTIN